MLLGRENERRALGEALARARSGHSAVLAVVGEPGIGKTALLDDAAETAEGMRVLRARGVESEMHLPFAGLFELLRPALHLIARLPPPRAQALEGALALRSGAADERFAVGAATLSLLAAYAEEAPVLMLVDDAHLLDASSAEAVRFAVRRLLAEPLAAVFAVRTGEPSLVDGSDMPLLQLGGLDRSSAAQLLGSGVTAEGVDRLYTATAGNPLALNELRAGGASAADAAGEPLPVSGAIIRAFARQAAPLDRATLSLLFLVAADDAGDLSTLSRAAAHLGLDLAALAPAEHARLIEMRETRIEFRHPLVRAAVFAMASPDERRSVHRALARALPDRDVDRRAWHLAAAAVGVDHAASTALEEAAKRAHLRSAYAVASAAFERASHLESEDLRRSRLLASAAEEAWLAGDAERALGLIDHAPDMADDPQLQVRSDRLRGQIATRRGPVMSGYRILVAAAERIAKEQPDVAIDLLAHAIDAGFIAAAGSDMMRAAGLIDELLPRATTNRARFLGHTASGIALVLTTDSRSGIARIRAGFRVLDEDQPLRGDMSLLPWLTVGPLFLREAGEMRGLVDEAITTARERAALGMLPWLLNRVGRDHAATTRWDSALIEHDEAARLARETAQHTEEAVALVGLAWLEARQGREEDCRTHAEEGLAQCVALGAHNLETWAIRALGDLETGLGHPAAALPYLERCEERLAELGVGDVDLSPAAELCDAYLRLGRAADARSVAARLDAAARAKAQPWSLARAARCRGLLAATEDIDACFREAVALHEQTPDLFELGVTHLSHGARLRRARRRTDSRVALRAAFDIFDRLGAAPWAEKARAELLATGETARSRSTSALDTLTKQELHIARLLADGATTREAAAAVFLSPKTVEYHLRSVYSKLGVNTRRELAKAIATM